MSHTGIYGSTGICGTTGPTGIRGFTGIQGITGTTGPIPAEEAYWELKKTLKNTPALYELFDKYGIDAGKETSNWLEKIVRENDFDNIPDEYLPMLIGIHPFIDKIIDKRLNGTSNSNKQ